MLWTAHISIPLVTTAIYVAQVDPQAPGSVLRWQAWVFIAMSGILPDLVSPHRRLQQRLSSWAHTLPFCVLVGIGAWAVAPWVCPDHPYAWPVLMLIGVTSHLLADAVTGGVKPFYPWSHQVYGYNAIPYIRGWLLMDVAAGCAILLCCAMVFR